MRFEQTSDEVFSFRNDFCPYRSDHDLNPYVDHNTLCFCGAKYKSNIINAVTDRLPESTHESEEAAAYTIYMQGVKVQWIIEFTNTYNCWKWPTWRVVEHIIKRNTLQGRCRYSALPEVSDSVGEPKFFVSHTWSGCWGLLVAAVSAYFPSERVWIDIFALRQWPGPPELYFEKVIQKVNGVLAVISSMERVAELSYLKLKTFDGVDSLSVEEQKQVPFLRVWCLVEIHASLTYRKPLVFACGRLLPSYAFEPIVPQLFNMQFLADIERASATFLSDKQMILDMIRKTVGSKELNRHVRAAINGAVVAPTCPSVPRIALGLEDDIKNSTSDDVGAAIIVAAAGGYREVIENILRLFPWACDYQNNLGVTPLMHAVRGGNASTIEFLLERCSNVDAVDKFGWCAMCYGSHSLNRQLTELLISRGWKANAASIVHPISLAAQAGNLEMCQAILDHDRSVIETRDDVGYTPLRHAIAFANREIAQMLLDYGANINALDNWKLSILGWAVRSSRNKMEMIKFVLDHGGTVDEVCIKNAKDFLLPGEEKDEILKILESLA